MTAAVLAGLGAVVPDRVVTNAMLAERMDTSDEWIRTRTGIRERRHVDPGTSTGDLACEAGRRALKSAGTEHVDAVVLATTTPDHPCPATAPTVAARLGLGTVPAYDVPAVCTGFLYALASAAGLIALGTARQVLVIGAETYSTIVDPDDRTTAPIFGDGAGAVVLRAGEPDEPGVLRDFVLGSDGDLADLIVIPGNGARQRTSGRPAEPGDEYFAMQGKAVYVNAVLRMRESSMTALQRAGWSAGSVDWLVGHQANVRILRSVAEHLGIPAEKAFVNLDRYGNTSAASIPLAREEGAVTGVLRPGHRVLLTAFGGGVTWGALTLEWPDVVV